MQPTIKHHKKNKARAQMDNVRLELSGQYSGMAYIKKIDTDSDGDMVCYETKAELNFKNYAVSVISDEIDLHFEDGQYVLKASQTRLECEGVYIKNPCLLFNSCDGSVILREYRATYKDFTISSDEDLCIKNFVFSGRNVAIRNKHIKANVGQLEINHLLNGKASNIFLKFGDLRCEVEKMDLFCDEEKQFDAKFNNITIRKNDLKIQTKSAFLSHDFACIFPDIIVLSNSDLKLVAVGGIIKNFTKQKILELHNVHVQWKNFEGYSKNGYFDIANQKLVLESGNITEKEQ